MLSGPAGAVVGAPQLCGQAGYRDLITMDIGSTSLDTCLVRGSVAEATTTREIDMFSTRSVSPASPRDPHARRPRMLAAHARRLGEAIFSPRQG